MKRSLFAGFSLLCLVIGGIFTFCTVGSLKIAYLVYLRDGLVAEIANRNPMLWQMLSERAQWIFVFGSLLILFNSIAVSAMVLFFVFRSQGKRAAMVMEALSEGDLKARIPETGFSIVDLIITNFNTMANHLEQVISSLRESQKRKIELVQELGHDLRTPLTSLRIALENIEYYYDKMTPEQRAFNVETVNYELNYMQRLIEFLFVLSKLNEPDYEVEFQSINLKKLLEDEIAIRRKAEAGNLKWEFQWEGEPIVIRGSPSLVIRLIRNLLDNGKKFAHTTVGIRWYVPEFGRGILSVYDDGEGMSPEKIVGHGDIEISEIDISDVFKAGKSLGIGTRIIKAIADLHSWEVSIAPPKEDGTGTNILFDIPLEREDLTVLSEVA